MNIKVQRVYNINTPLKNAILIDRLWPRGISKATLNGVPWVRELAPSNELRRWFHEDKDARWTAFNRKYQAELKQNKKLIIDIVSKYKKEITLLTAAREIDTSHIPTLKSFLINCL